jgi:hypothetical protein
METLRELGRKLYNTVAGAKQPTKRQLLKLDSKLICQIARDPIQCGLHVSYLVTAFEAVPVSALPLSHHGLQSQAVAVSALAWCGGRCTRRETGARKKSFSSW